MLFGDILRDLLEERGITQKKLATDLNIASSTLGNYIRNIREPDFRTLKAIAAYFQISIDYLLDYHLNQIEDYGENQLLQIYRSLSQEQRELYLEQGKVFVRINHKQKIISSPSKLSSDHNVG